MKSPSVIWYPFTQAKTMDAPLHIEKGKGTCVYDKEGRCFLDMISSWWVNIHGHAHPAIAKAIYDQAQQLEHIIFAGFTHTPAKTLCEKLQTILPSSLTHFFFSDNGSSAVEVALKMAYQYWWNKGSIHKKTFLCFDHAYHGDTFGAMSAGKASGFFKPFESFLFKTISIPYASTWLKDGGVEEKEEASLKAVEKILEKSHLDIAAFIMEPLIQGAGGMNMCRPVFLNKLIKLLKKYHILIIFDEVMTGFGRTGHYFAMDHLEEKPDFVCLSKGLTGGFLPMALTLTSQKIYDAFLGDTFDKAFAHGHSYTANPLGCAAAIASFDVLTNPHTKNQWIMIQEQFRNFLTFLMEEFSDAIFAPRIQGNVCAFNVFEEKHTYTHNLVTLLKKDFLKEGLLIRPLGNSVYLMPPYCITKEEITQCFTGVEKVLKKHLVL